MCTNTKVIYNPYVKQIVRVDCGHCPACLQQKAASRANRIRNTLSPVYVPLFVTLTYYSWACPYVYLEDLFDGADTLRVYRSSLCRFVRSSSGYDTDVRYMDGCELDSIAVIYKQVYSDTFKELVRKRVKTKSGYKLFYYDIPRVGVCYYKDLQDFFKRFRINLFRQYGIKEKFHFYACSDLGEDTQRPHFHLVIFTPRRYEQECRKAIVKSWPYGDMRNPKRIQVAINAASYVSSYVNHASDFPKFFKDNVFKQKHSYSHGFGLAVTAFSLSEILEKAHSGNMYYPRWIKRNGIFELVNVPIPKYVLSRYFPRFKGYSRLDVHTLAECIYNPDKLREFAFELNYSDDDLHKIKVRLSHCKEFYQKTTGRSDFDFVRDYDTVWRARSSYCLKHSFSDIHDVYDFCGHYENLDEFKAGVVHSPTLDCLDKDKLVTDPNLLPWRLVMTSRLTDMYRNICQRHSVNSLALSESDIGF